MIAEQQCGLSAATQEKLRSVFMKHQGIEKVLLYGSRAIGKFKPGSDIDLTIYAENLSTQDLLALQNEIDDLLLPYKVDLSLYHYLDHASLLEHIKDAGLVFYP